MSQYLFLVDLNTSVSTIRNLYGAVTGPRTVATQCHEEDQFEFDFSDLYKIIGVKSVRTHDTDLDVSNIYREDSTSFSHGLHTTMATDDVPDENAILCSESENLAPGVEWIFWYPNSFTPGDTHFDYQPYYDHNGLTRLKVVENYDAIPLFGCEIYFRVGEAYYGPTYFNLHQDSSYTVDSRKQLFAQVAAQIIRDLGFSPDPSFGLSQYRIPPSFLEIWNEPDALCYQGEHWLGADSGDVGETELFAEDFASLYNHIYDQLNSVVQSEGGGIIPIGGCGFVKDSLLDLAEKWVSGNPTENIVYQFLYRMDNYDFISFHLYATDNSTNDTLQWKLKACEFPANLQTICGVLGDYIAQFCPGTPKHLTEWNICVPKIDQGTMGNTIFGAAFISAALAWMQEPSLGLERAHYFSGQGLSDCFVFPVSSSATMYPAAYAFWLNRQLIGKQMFQVFGMELDSYNDRIVENMLEAAESDDDYEPYSIYAISAGPSAASAPPGTTERLIATTILSNIDAENTEHTAYVAFSGLDDNTLYNVKVTSISEDTLHATEAIPLTMNSNDYDDHKRPDLSSMFCDADSNLDVETSTIMVESFFGLAIVEVPMICGAARIELSETVAGFFPELDPSITGSLLGEREVWSQLDSERREAAVRRKQSTDKFELTSDLHVAIEKLLAKCKLNRE